MEWVPPIAGKVERQKETPEKMLLDLPRPWMLNPANAGVVCHPLPQARLTLLSESEIASLVAAKSHPQFLLQKTAERRAEGRT